MATKTLHHSDALDHTLPLGVSHSSRLKDGRARPTGTKRRRLSETGPSSRDQIRRSRHEEKVVVGRAIHSKQQLRVWQELAERVRDTVDVVSRVVGWPAAVEAVGGVSHQHNFSQVFGEAGGEVLVGAHWVDVPATCKAEQGITTSGRARRSVG